MDAGRVVGQSRCFRKSRPLLRLNRSSDGPPSTDATSHTLQRSALECGAWSAAPPAGARETRFEECEGHHQTHICRRRAKGLLGRTWLFPLRRNLIKESRPMIQVIAESLSHQQGGHMRSAVERIAAFAAAARPEHLTNDTRRLF